MLNGYRNNKILELPDIWRYCALLWNRFMYMYRHTCANVWCSKLFVLCYIQTHIPTTSLTTKESTFYFIYRDYLECLSLILLSIQTLIIKLRSKIVDGAWFYYSSKSAYFRYDCFVYILVIRRIFLTSRDLYLTSKTFLFTSYKLLFDTATLVEHSWLYFLYKQMPGNKYSIYKTFWCI